MCTISHQGVNVLQIWVRGWFTPWGEATTTSQVLKKQNAISITFILSLLSLHKIAMSFIICCLWLPLTVKVLKGLWHWPTIVSSFPAKSRYPLASVEQFSKIWRWKREINWQFVCFGIQRHLWTSSLNDFPNLECLSTDVYFKDHREMEVVSQKLKHLKLHLEMARQVLLSRLLTQFIWKISS